MSVSSPPPAGSYTPLDGISGIVADTRRYFQTHVTKSAKWRKEQLRGLLRLLSENESAIAAALAADLGKPEFEAKFAEVVTVETEIKTVLAEIDAWVRPQNYPTPAALLPGSSFVQRDPYGVVLVIGAFNYPIQLTVLPLVAALSAGNCAVIKPSELTPASSALLASLLPRYTDPKAIRVVLGGVSETSALLKEKWDYIFFTGSDVVGKIVAKAAAENLTPYTLELGGKSPTIIAPDADLKLAARRVIWGKVLNCGQTCIAPDYVFVPSELKRPFVDECKAVLQQFFGGNVATTKDYGRIVNERHAKRIAALIDASKDKVLVGGQYDIQSKFVEPTIVDADTSSPVMKDEIFGPILPVISYDDVNTVIDFINSRSKPLALYVFTASSKFSDRFLKETSSGGVSINDVMMHFANPNLPFGGVGGSGQGNYHGKFGFETFSHAKGVLNKSVYGDAPARYPPYTPFNAKLFRFVASIYRVNSATFGKVFKLVVLPLVIAALAHRAGFTVGFKSNL